MQKQMWTPFKHNFDIPSTTLKNCHIPTHLSKTINHQRALLPTETEVSRKESIDKPESVCRAEQRQCIICSANKNTLAYVAHENKTANQSPKRSIEEKRSQIEELRESFMAKMRWMTPLSDQQQRCMQYFNFRADILQTP